METSLVLRFERSGQGPGTYKVEAILNNASAVRAVLNFSAEDLRKLEPRQQWDYGRALGQSAFADANLRSALTFARGKGDGRVSLSIDIDPEASELHDILWERLILVNGDEEVAPAADTRFALCRRMVREEPAGSPGEGVFRLLLAIASPVELDDAPEDSPLAAIKTTNEIASLRLAWDQLVQRGLLRVRILARMAGEMESSLRAAGYDVRNRAATLDSMSDALTGLDSLHLLCHGTFKAGTASLLMEDEDGHRAIVPEQEFLPRLGTGSLRLVFLQSCKSAQREYGSANSLSGLAPKVARHAAAVIAMQDLVQMEDASRFAQEFYRSLLATGSPATAVTAGRQILFRPGSVNWAIPSLYLTPDGEPIWVPDAVLAAAQELALRFRQKPEVAVPFPTEVIRLTEGISASMETSPPGPRTRVSDAVSALLFPPGGSRINRIILAGNYGRGKTSQLYSLYTEYAGKVAAGGALPLFVRPANFELRDVPPAEAVARAVARTYADELGVELPWKAVESRLAGDFILFVGAGEDIDRRKRVFAFEMAAQLVEGRSSAAVIATLDSQSIAEADALSVRDEPPAILLFQLLSPASVAQYLQGLPKDVGGRMLNDIRKNNLFDLAGVPWLLSSLLRQFNRGALSRSGVIARIVAGNLMAVNWPSGVRKMVSEALGLIAWTMFQEQTSQLPGNRLYAILESVRGRREIPLDSLRDAALQSSLVCPTDDDSVRFAYSGFQAYWCAQHLIDSDPGIWRHIDDITATLGRPSRVRLWEDTLVLLSGLMEQPDPLIQRIATGASLSQGPQLFLAATCIHEARLNGREVSQEVVSHVADSLVWCSTAARESDPAVRIRAIECLGLLRDPTTVPHIFSLVFDRVRMQDGKASFEYSGIREAAVHVLLSMEEEAGAHLTNLLAAPDPRPELQLIRPLVDAWRAGDSKRMQEIFTQSSDGVSGVAAFGLGALGDGNLEFLADRLQDPKTDEDTAWAIAEALLNMNPAEVTRRAIRPIYNRTELGSIAAFVLGRLAIARSGDEDFTFLCSVLKSGNAKSQGMALRSLAQLGDSSWLPACEALATADWDTAEKHGFAAPQNPADRAILRFYALEALRLIGTPESGARLRLARHRPEGDWPDNFMTLSYEVSEDIFRRCIASDRCAAAEPAANKRKVMAF